MKIPDPRLASALLTMLECDDCSKDHELCQMALEEFTARLAQGAEVNGYYQGSTLLAHATDRGRADLVSQLLEQGAKVNDRAHERGSFGLHRRTAAYSTTDPETARVLAKAGARLEDFSPDLLPAALGIALGHETVKVDLLNKALAGAVRGKGNPQRFSNSFYDRQIRTFHTAAGGLINHTDAMKEDWQNCAPSFSFDRVGRTMTVLEDGRVVFVGGVHEDSYDPDFFIYNDVCVIHPDARIDYFLYPATAFPPTCYHTATLVGRSLWLIGNLGYQDQRAAGKVQVLRLDLRSFAISQVPTTGNSPGCISSHSARMEDGKIIISGGTVRPVQPERADLSYQLNLKTGVWSVIEAGG